MGPISDQRHGRGVGAADPGAVCGQFHRLGLNSAGALARQQRRRVLTAVMLSLTLIDQWPLRDHLTAITQRPIARWTRLRTRSDGRLELLVIDADTLPRSFAKEVRNQAFYRVVQGP